MEQSPVPVVIPVSLRIAALSVHDLHSIYYKEKQASVSKELQSLQKGGVPATPSGTATLLRLSPSY